MSQRGGAVQSNLWLASEPIHSDIVPLGTADIILSMEPVESLRYLEFLAPNGFVITATEPVENIPDYPDINEILAVKDDPARAREFILKGQALFSKIEAGPKPVIAAVNAVALGGGLELAMACHIRILSDRARVGQPESNLGIIPGWGGTQRLARLVGPGKALELILTADIINAQEAYRLGLANKVVPAGQVLHEAMGLAKKIAGKSKLATTAALRAVINGLKMSLADGLLYEADQFTALGGSHDMTEGLTAFVEKRQPKFTDN